MFKKQFFAGHKDAAENPTLAQGPYVERREQETGSHGYSCTHGRAGNKVKGKTGSRLTSNTVHMYVGSKIILGK